MTAQLQNLSMNSLVCNLHLQVWCSSQYQDCILANCYILWNRHVALVSWIGNLYTNLTVEGTVHNLDCNRHQRPAFGAYVCTPVMEKQSNSNRDETHIMARILFDMYYNISEKKQDKCDCISNMPLHYTVNKAFFLVGISGMEQKIYTYKCSCQLICTTLGHIPHAPQC